MRFIINFFIFGMIFFLIWKFFPEAFTTLIDWAGNVYNFFAELFRDIAAWLTAKKREVSQPSAFWWLSFLE